MKFERCFFRLFILLFLTLGLGPFAYAGEVMITKVEGGPEIMREGKMMPAAVGMACQKNDLLKTSSGCMVDVSMNGMAGCRVLPSSECAIMDENPRAMNLKVQSGNVILNLDKLPSNSSFQLETPTAVASVRGTQFWGRVDLNQIANPVTTFAVRQGTVEVFAKSVSQSFTLQKGQALDIPKEGAAAPEIRPALAEELEAMNQADEIKKSA